MEKFPVVEVKESLSLPQIREMHELVYEVVNVSRDYSGFSDPWRGEKALGRMLAILEAEPQRKPPKRAAKLRNAGPNGDSAADLLGDAIGMLESAKGSVPKATVLDMEKKIDEVIGVLRELEVTQAA